MVTRRLALVAGGIVVLDSLAAGRSSAASSAALTLTSKLLAPARVEFAHASRYFRRAPHGAYTDADIDYIVRHHLDACRPVGLDPLVCFAQLVVETGHLTSFWAARPRCNPAGIGVTRESNPDGSPKGISFGRWGWDSEAAGGGSIRAHVGRLLLYAIKVGHGTPAQNVLMTRRSAGGPSRTTGAARSRRSAAWPARGRRTRGTAPRSWRPVERS
jgi:hypothetical protein